MCIGRECLVVVWLSSALFYSSGVLFSLFLWSCLTHAHIKGLAAAQLFRRRGREKKRLEQEKKKTKMEEMEEKQQEPSREEEKEATLGCVCVSWGVLFLILGTLSTQILTQLQHKTGEEGYRLLCVGCVCITQHTHNNNTQKHREEEWR